MTIANKINELSNAELKELLSDPSTQLELENQLETDPEYTLGLLLNKKMLPDFITNHIEKLNLYPIFFNLCIEANFTPPINLIFNFLKSEPSDLLLAKIIKTFSSLPYPSQFLMELINNDFKQSALQLVNLKSEFQKEEIYDLFLKRNWMNQNLVEQIVNNDAMVSAIMSNLKSYSSEFDYPVELLNHLILTRNDLPFKNLISKQKPFSSQAMEKLLRYLNKDMVNTPRYAQSKAAIVWTDYLEKIPESELRWVHLIDVPPHSKYRTKYLKNNPEEGSDEEIIDLIESGNASQAVFENFVQRDIEVIKKISLDKAIDKISPADLARSASRNTNANETLVYLYNNLPSKFKPAIKKYLKVEHLEKLDTTRKKSYFVEIFQALSDQDINAFRKALSYGYSLEKFCEDTHQSSKKDACEKLTLREEIITELTKEEFLLLSKTPIRLYIFSKKLPYILNAEEAFSLIDKLSMATIYNSCSDKCGLINHPYLKEDDLSELWSIYHREISSDPEILSTFLERIKNGTKICLNSIEQIMAIANQLTFEEFRLCVEIEDYELNSCGLIKTKDAKYILTERELLNRLKDRTHIENETLLNDLIIRNPELAQKLIEAYLGGNAELSNFFGSPVKITRRKIPYFKEMQSYVKMDVESEINQIFDQGGNLAEFQQKIPHSWQAAIIKYGPGKQIKASSLDLKLLIEMQDNGINNPIVINELIFSRIPYNEINFSNITVQKLSIVLEQDLEDEESVNELIKNINKLNAVDVVLMDQNSLRTKLALIQHGGSIISNPSTIIAEALAHREFLLECSLNEFNFLAEQGLIFNSEFVYFLINNLSSHYRYVHESSEVVGKLNTIISRVGSLKNYIFDEEELPRYQEEIKKLLINAGAIVLDSQSFMLNNIKQKIKQEGPEFSAIDIENLSYNEKKDLIRFIGDSVDSRYQQLNFQAINIEKLSVLNSYPEMKLFYSLDKKDIESFFIIPSNVLENKKILKEIKDLISLNTSIITKIDLVKKVVSGLNPQLNLNYQDFITIEGSKTVEESEAMAEINISVLSSILEHIRDIQTQSIILKNQKKANIFRFLKTASKQNDRYIDDILECIKKIVSGVEGVEERISILSEDLEANQENIKNLALSINGVREKLEEIATMDDAVHMHDRLIKLASFIQSDKQQPLRQDRFSQFEKSKELVEEFGYSVYFPKTRGELKFLGDIHGWCVNNNTSYGDGVINKGNILVGICEKGSESNIDNVIALAHFLNERGNFQLEQLKWSKKKMSGRTNVDATSSFNHNLLNQLIIKELAKKKV